MPTTKEDARRFIADRVAHPRPLPDRDQLRRELGMDLIDAARKPEFPLPSEQLPKTD
jgi:hypothetical protein